MIRIRRLIDRVFFFFFAGVWIMLEPVQIVAGGGFQEITAIFFSSSLRASWLMLVCSLLEEGLDCSRCPDCLLPRHHVRRNTHQVGA